MVGRLNCVFGSRDVSNSWMQDWRSLLQSEGCAIALNSIIVSVASEGHRFVQITLDTRHLQLILKSLGLLKSSSAVSTPGTGRIDDQVARRNEEAQLSPTMTTVFRFCLMRASFLPQDRADSGKSGGTFLLDKCRDHRRFRWKIS